MELVKGSTSLVLLGIWNPAILSADWLARFAFNREGEIPVTMEFASFPGLPPRLTIEGLVIQPGRTRVIISSAGQDGDSELDKIEAVARAILTQLPHTPMQAVGQNLEFVEANPDDEQLSIFASSNDLPGKCDFELESVGQKVVSSISFAGRTLNLTRTFANGRLSVAFNFHYDIPNAQAAVDKIANDNSLKENRQYAFRIMKSLYGVDFAPQPAEEPAHV